MDVYERVCKNGRAREGVPERALFTKVRDTDLQNLPSVSFFT